MIQDCLSLSHTLPFLEILLVWRVTSSSLERERYPHGLVSVSVLGECYRKLQAALQSVEKEKVRQASAAQSLQERLSRAQEEISSLQASITQRASHYQQLHSQLLDKAAQATTLEKEVINSVERCKANLGLSFIKKLEF